MDCKDCIVAGVGFILTGVGIYFAYKAAKYSKGLYDKYTEDRHEDFEEGNKILTVERRDSNPKGFHVTIKNRNGIARIGIDEARLESREGHVVQFRTLEDLRDEPMRYIEAGGKERFDLRPPGMDSWQHINAIPCTFSIVDTNGGIDTIILNRSGMGVLYDHRQN